jgi:hypothetical protein
MAPQDEALVRATAEANEIFDRMRALVEEQVEQGAAELNVLDVAQRAGLEVNAGTLSELQIPSTIPVIRFLPYHVWWPWRPFWCWLWRLRWPWYCCCPYWWHRCHWWAA